MKKRHSRVLASLLAAVGALVLAGVRGESPPPAAALQNPSFDDPGGTRGIPGWQQRGERFGGAQLVSSPVVSAPRALELTASGPGSTGDSSFMLYQVLDHARFRGKKVRFGARVMTEGAGVNLVLYTPEGMANDFDPDVKSGAFRARAGVLDVPANASYLSFGIQLFGTPGARAWVDDAFVRAEGAPDAPPQAAEVEIDVTSGTRPLSMLLFGAHLEWVEDGQGVLDPERPVLRKPVLDALLPLHIPLFRFPGGIHADYYDWQAGIGPPERRGSGTNVFTRKTERHRFGTPEFASLLEATGAEGLITANYGTGTGEAAGRWAQAFKSTGRRPRYWEVGNEIYLSGPRSDGPNGKAIYRRPEDYARDYPGYRAAIRSAIPDARVGAIAHVDDGAFPLSPADNLDWSERMLEKLAGPVDFIAVHNAYAPVLLDDSVDFKDAAARRDVYAAMMASPVQVRGNLDAVSRMVARRSPVNRDAPIAVTEFGPFFGLSAKPDRHSAYVDQTRTMAAALYVASVLDVFIGDPRVFLGCYTNPIHRWYGSLLTDTDKGLVKTPTYHLYALYRSRFEPSLVTTRVVSPTFATRTIGILKAQTGVPALLARASVSVDRRTLTAMLVNRSLERPLPTRLTLKGFRASSVDCRVIAAPPSAINGPALTATTVSGGEEIAPRAFPCRPGATIDLDVPASAILSLVARQ